MIESFGTPTLPEISKYQSARDRFGRQHSSLHNYLWISFSLRCTQSHRVFTHTKVISDTSKRDMLHTPNAALHVEKLQRCRDTKLLYLNTSFLWMDNFPLRNQRRCLKICYRLVEFLQIPPTPKTRNLRWSGFFPMHSCS